MKKETFKVFASGMPIPIIILFYYTLLLTQPNGILITAGSEFLFEALIVLPIILGLAIYSFIYDFQNLGKGGCDEK